jgi:UDP-N-acetylglucosamine 2-epimerase (non-hydrolysing)/GDP/UDP-N,N'-diacetylbacillosamine 2-epimerase (hydrolysing)
MRTIAVVTVGRSDYGIYREVLRSIQADPELELRLMVSGAHLSPEFGLTVRAIETDGFPIGDRIPMLLASDAPEGIGTSIGVGVIGFAQAFARSRPDILVVLGDRFEMYAAALAALPFVIPVAHIHGGELTHGAIDDALRHAMTKMSHLHFVSTAEYARRVAQLGEEPWRIVVTGAPALDNLRTLRLLPAHELEASLGLRLDPPPLIVTFHPTTLEYDKVERQTEELLGALDDANLPIVFTQTNADTGGRRVGAAIARFLVSHPAARRVDNLGVQGYFSLMRVAAAMVGNSSSGIIEAPSFGLPVVNVGNRQSGRVRAANVIDVGNSRADILDGIRWATQPALRAGLANVTNPYDAGGAAPRIVDTLRRVPLGPPLTMKRFTDWPVQPPSHAS